MRKTTRPPRARTSGLIVKELAKEVLVYDVKRDKAHCLNATAAAVWNLCDGLSSVEQIARRLKVEVESGQDSDGSKQGTGDPHDPTLRKDARAGANSRTIGEDLAGESTSIDEEVVWLALAQLRRSHLLEESVDSGQLPRIITGMSRREVVRRIGIGAAIALPIVVSITAPSPAQAGTCRQSGQSCGTGSQCCSTVCSSNVCV